MNKTLIVYPNMPLQFSLPHSVGRISAALKLAGDDVKLFDTTLYKTQTTDEEKRIARGQLLPYEARDLKTTDMREDFVACVEDYKPDRIMITFVDNTLDIGMSLLNANSTPVKTIAGGVTAILCPECVQSPKIHAVCRTSIEVYLFGTSNVKLFDDWTIFEPARMYRPMSGKYYKTVPLLTDVGCPYSCGFCCAPALRNYIKYRRRPIEEVIEELDYQVELHSPEFIYFSSETFFSLSKRALAAFANAYSRYSLPFWCQTHVNTITEERVKLLKEMNCHKVAIGIECGNAQYRRAMIGKHFTNEQAVKAFELLEKYGISAAANNMVGLPLETEKQMKETVALNKEIYRVMPNVQLNCYIFQPYYGTRLRDDCERLGLLKPVKPDTVLGDPVIRNPRVSDAKIKHYAHNFHALVTGDS